MENSQPITPIQHNTERSSQSNQARKRNNMYRKKEGKLSLFVDNIILHAENPKDSTKTSQN